MTGVLSVARSTAGFSGAGAAVESVGASDRWQAASATVTASARLRGFSEERFTTGSRPVAGRKG
jgi:hypothetical protein